MPRPIDADALKNMRFSCGMHDDKYVVYAPIREVMENIDKAPTIDAVPVVRCKDCKWFINDHNEVDGWMTCTLLRQEVDKEWFCANGERKDDEKKMD